MLWMSRRLGRSPVADSCGHRLGVTLVGVDELHHGGEHRVNGQLLAFGGREPDGGGELVSSRSM
jgi:hypothetical protein